MAQTNKVTNVTTINDLPDELLELISILAGPTEYCTLRRAMKRLWLYTSGREDHCIKHFLVTKIDEDGDTIITLCGKRHSMFDRPSHIGSDGSQIWYQHDKSHRDNDLPAYIRSDGTQVWVQYGAFHRDNDQPSLIYSDGSKLWYQHDKCHRDNDLPAIIRSNGIKRWYKHGVEYTP